MSTFCKSGTKRLMWKMAKKRNQKRAKLLSKLLSHMRCRIKSIKDLVLPPIEASLMYAY